MLATTRLRSALAAIVAGMLAGACSNKHDNLAGPSPLDPSEVPPTPTNVVVSVSSSNVTLSWQISNPTGVREYRIYRSEETPSDFEYLASTGQTAYSDQQVVNGVTYHYQIAAVKGPLEGNRSATVSAVPNLFSIVIEGGAAATNGDRIVPGSGQVEYVMAAPATTVSYRIGEDATFAGGSEIGFDPGAPRGIIALSPGDGRKTLYARFTGAGGAISATVSSSIVLDTRAIIHSLTEDSGGSVLHVNDVLHVAMEVDTTGGTATVDVGNVVSNLRLYDDGTNGDPVALDGICELDLAITAGLEVVEAVLHGAFRDPVGNDANPVTAATKVTIADPPAQVSFAPAEIVGAKVTLRWSLNSDADFAAYRAFRTPGDDLADPVSENDILVATIADRNQPSFLVGDLVGGTGYQFGVQAVDGNGFASALDTVTVHTAHDPTISGTTLTPTLGSPGTNFTYGCTYRHAGGLAPTAVQVIVDGGITYNMTKVGPGSNWPGGEAYTVTTNLVSGSHTYHFVAQATDGSSTRTPSAPNVFGGPVVTQ